MNCALAMVAFNVSGYPNQADVGGGDDGRVVCQARIATIWTTMLSAYLTSEVLA